MYTSLEIEFKCKIDEDTYKLLLEEFNLTNEVKTQINYYIIEFIILLSVKMKELCL